MKNFEMISNNVIPRKCVKMQGKDRFAKKIIINVFHELGVRVGTKSKRLRNNS